MMDATTFRVRPRDFVDADLKSIHDSPRTDTREVLQNTLKWDIAAAYRKRREERHGLRFYLCGQEPMSWVTDAENFGFRTGLVVPHPQARREAAPSVGR